MLRQPKPRLPRKLVVRSRHKNTRVRWSRISKERRRKRDAQKANLRKT